MNHKKRLYTIATIVFILDQLIKIILTKTISEKGIIKIIPNFFSLYYIKNTGAAFSILENKQVLLIAISAIIIVIIHRIVEKENLNNKTTIYYGKLIGGIFGNLLDRITRNAVIDYLHFTFFNYSFPVFNFADSMIVIGILLLVIEELIKKEG